MGKHIGDQTIKIDSPVSVISTASIVGPKEGQGPLARYFDMILNDVLHGTDSWEKAESKIVTGTMDLVVKKAGLEYKDMDLIIAGDLLNQNTSSTFGIMNTERPYLGIFSACSTMGEAMTIGSAIIDSGCAERVLVGASSHFCSAEKQFRFPLDLGNQRPPASTWTVTGDGCAVLARSDKGPFITHSTVGKIVDMGIKDANNMGAAMAPAAVDTMAAHFKDTGRDPAYYDMIITGDLGYIGHELVLRLMKEEGYNIEDNYTDCGIKIFDQKTQDTHSGGSGCACSAVTFAGYLYSHLKEKTLNKILFIPTGALLSTTSSQQGQSIPGIAHAVAIENSK